MRNGALLARRVQWIVMLWTMMLLPFAEPLRSQEEPAQRVLASSCIPFLKNAKLLGHRSGWAILEEPSNDPAKDTVCETHLLWTGTNGRTWTDITPSEKLGIGSVFFLDRRNGWLFSTEGEPEVENLRTYLQATTDGGRTWSKQRLEAPDPRFTENIYVSDVFFSDAKHGWLIWRWAMMNSRRNFLLTTNDGGRSWKQLPEPPGPGPMQFTSRNDGWMIGASPGQEGIPINESDALWVTHDGGSSWKQVAVPVPDALPNGTWFSGLKFSDKGKGVVTGATALSDYSYRFFKGETKNGGKSWKFSQFEGYQADASIADGDVIWSVFDWQTKKSWLRRGESEFTPRLTDGTILEQGFGSADFADGANGWARYLNRGARLAALKNARYAPSELLATSDGGKTFAVITPPQAVAVPFPAPELTGVNGVFIKAPNTWGLRERPNTYGLGLQRKSVEAHGREPHLSLSQRASAGGPIALSGSWFLAENTVWFGDRAVKATSKDGQHLLLLVPADLPPSHYRIWVENEDGKTDSVEMMIDPQEKLEISIVGSHGTAEPAAVIHGQEVIIVGRGFLVDNEVWFGTTKVAAEVRLSGGAFLKVQVPDSLPPGPCEVYVNNLNGRSNSVTVVVE
jgi:photosystem II stability/assembly factor-like uncharacterized protein